MKLMPMDRTRVDTYELQVFWAASWHTAVGKRYRIEDITEYDREQARKKWGYECQQRIVMHRCESFEVTKP